MSNELRNDVECVYYAPDAACRVLIAFSLKPLARFLQMLDAASDFPESMGNAEMTLHPFASSLFPSLTTH